MAKKLKVYGGPDHPHASQQPEALDLSRTPKRAKEF
jgi:ribosomal protein L13